MEQTIDKIIKKSEKQVVSDLKDAGLNFKQNLDDSVAKLESEYDKILSDGKKEADKIEKQIVGVLILKPEISNF